MLQRRVDILLDDACQRRVAAAARELAAVIRHAIDVALSSHPDRSRAAADAVLAAEPMDVPETVGELKAELCEARCGGR